MNRQLKNIVCLLTLVLCASGASRAQAQTNAQWQGTPGSQNWGTTTNWSTGFVPDGQFNEAAVLNNGNTAVVNSPFNDATRTGSGGPGNITVTTGTLQIQNGGHLQLFAPTTAPLVQRIVTITSTLGIQGNGRLEANTLNLGANSVLDIDFTPATTTPIALTGNAALAGTLNLDFTASPTPGARTLMTAPSYSGAFTNVVTTGLPNAVSVSVGRSGATSLVASVINVPTLTIDRVSGKATLTNTHATPVSLDAFAVRSAAAGLHTANFAGIGVAGWTTPPGNSSTVVGQAFEGNASVSTSPLAAGFTRQLGNNGFWSLPAAQFFNQPTEDVVFEITDPSYGPNPIRGLVTYTGTKVVNNTIALYIDPATGNASLRNSSPFPQEVEGYRIKSTSGLAANALQTATWNSLDLQNTDDGTWSVSGISGATQLVELQQGLTGQLGTTTFSNDVAHTYNIGKILNPGFTQSGFELEFLLAGQQAFTLGAVVFAAVPPLLPDFNGNGKVDAADYTVWRDHFGLTGGATLAQGDANGDGNVNAADYAAWKANFGAHSGSGSGSFSAGTNVPEPSALSLLGAGLMLGMSQVRRRAGDWV